MLYSNEIVQILRAVQHFRGVFSLDKLPHILPRKLSSYIINLEESYKEGSHWIALFTNKNFAFYFDSLGNPPPDHISNILDRNFRSLWYYNKDKFQVDVSNSCGYFCIAFILCCPNIIKFYKKFKPCKNNEMKVFNFVKDYIFNGIK